MFLNFNQESIKEVTMAEKKVTYKCVECGRTTDCAVNINAPECHGKTMTPLEELEGCTVTVTAEQERLENEDAPCDDGRTGKV